MAKKRMIQAINETLDSEMAKDHKIVIFGEDVEISLFGDTRGLKDKHGAHRVRNMPISETVMSGMAVGAAAAGYKVVCHMMFGNFMYTGFDSIANQASKLRYMTAGQITLPIVYMGVFGGGRSAAAQHSDSMHPIFMNLGGLKVALPATPADAMGLLRTSIHDPNPVIFLQAAGRGGATAQWLPARALLWLALAAEPVAWCRAYRPVPRTCRGWKWGTRARVVTTREAGNSPGNLSLGEHGD